MVEESQASSGGAANGSKVNDTKAMKEEEKAEEQAPVESDEESGGNQTQPLAQTDNSNVAQQAYGNIVEILSLPDFPDDGKASSGVGETPRTSNVKRTSNGGLTLAMGDDDADDSSLHMEDGLEAGMNEAPESPFLRTTMSGESLRQVSFQNHPPNRHDSSTDFESNSCESNSDLDQNGDSMISFMSRLESNRVEQLKGASGSPARHRHETPPPQSPRTFVKNKQRISLVVNIESGKEKTRAQQALIRDESQSQPTSLGARRRRGVKRFLSQSTSKSPRWSLAADESDKERYAADESDKERYAADESDKECSDDARKGHGQLMVQSPRVLVDDAMEGDTNAFGMSALEKPESERNHIETQYRLQALSPVSGKFSQMARGFGFSAGTGIYEEPTMAGDNGCKIFGINPNKIVVQYLNWAFRSSFVAVFFSAAAAFYGLCLGFAILIYASGMNKPDCVYVNGVAFGTTGANFMDAFALSWTTFSTVGYGLVFPATSTTNGDVHQCTGITILTTMESFVGILFASVCGAIVFAKVTRIASFAQVQFSDAVVIRYGNELSNVDDDENSDEEPDKSQEMKLSKLPCPLLEFRVINRLHSEMGGEIIDATMNIVASIDEKQASDALRNSASNPRRRGKKGKRRGLRRGKSRKRATSPEFKHISLHKYKCAKDSLETMFASAAHKNNQRMDEDPTGMIVPRRIFAKLEIESPEHPFFKRVWLARHALDHHSPLLRQEARELVRLNGGHWPHELNNAEAVRASVHFDQILVSLSGTSNVDANSVYAQKVYEFVDVCVGYRFVNLLYRDERDRCLAVDPSLLNDVTEQNGGGGEDLNAVKENAFIV